MGKLQNITLATAISILSLNTIKIADASAFSSKLKFLSLTSNTKNIAETSSEDTISISTTAKVTQYELAQKPKSSSTDKNSPKNGDEMIDALQKRQDKIENLKELKQIQDKINSENLNHKKLDALQKRNLNIESLEEFKELQEIVNDDNLDNYEKLDALKESQINIESIEELQKIQKIVKNEKFTEDIPGITVYQKYAKYLADL